MEMRDYVERLKTGLQAPGIHNPSYEKRHHNIIWVQSLDRDRAGLKNQIKERQLFLHTTQTKEELCIQYPGRGAALHTLRGIRRSDENIRPWDFRPKLLLPNGELFPKDLSFFDIWSTLFKNAEELARRGNTDALKILAILFYRMAFMIDHSPMEGRPCRYVDVLIGKGERGRGEVTSPQPLHLYAPPPAAMDVLSRLRLDWSGMSFEAFLYYNDFLAWNEDCKYYYRHVEVQGRRGWINGTGRINTILTHLRFLGTCLGLVSLASLLEKFVQNRGVSPASDEDIQKICGEFIC